MLNRLSKTVSLGLNDSSVQAKSAQFYLWYGLYLHALFVKPMSTDCFKIEVEVGFTIIFANALSSVMQKTVGLCSKR